MTLCVEVQITHFHQDFGAPEVPLSSSAVLSQQLQGAHLAAALPHVSSHGRHLLRWTELSSHNRLDGPATS